MAAALKRAGDPWDAWDAWDSTAQKQLKQPHLGNGVRMTNKNHLQFHIQGLKRQVPLSFTPGMFGAEIVTPMAAVIWVAISSFNPATRWRHSYRSIDLI